MSQEPFTTLAHRLSAYKQRRAASAWKLLAADNAPLILGILQSLLAEQEQGLASTILHERLAQALQEAQSQGFYLPQTAQSYAAEWLSAGYLKRTFPQDAAEEIYALSRAAIQALQFVEGLNTQHRSATESRLSLVIQQLAQLAEQTDPDPRVRIAQLEKKRRHIDQQIQQIHAGILTPMQSERAIETTDEIVNLAKELVQDFHRVQDNFYALNRTLREEIVDNQGNRGEILNRLFAGVDIINESEAGRSFKAFWRLLIDPEQSLILEEAIEQLLTRPFAQQLPRETRQFLFKLTHILLAQGGSVHEVLQSFARSLKHFVQSSGYQEQRRLMQLLREAQRQALTLKEQIHPIEVIIPTFYLTSSRIRSIAQRLLFDPTLRTTLPLQINNDLTDISAATLQAWIMQSEINFQQLKTHILSLVNIHQQVSIGEVLQVFPAEQGLGTIIGYLALGLQYGDKTSQQEMLTWQGTDKVTRAALIPCIYFLEKSCHGFY